MPSHSSRARIEKEKLAEQAILMFEEYGKEPFRVAKRAISESKYIEEPVSKVIDYFFGEIWQGSHYPVLTSLSCEAVGGEISDATSMGAALVLLAGAADLHDDIIDRSKTKYSKPTVYGKFGEDLTLLTGDALLYKGLTLLSRSCEEFSTEKRREILDLIEIAFFTIGCAEARESDIKGKQGVLPKELLRIVDQKASVAEAAMKVGAIIGGGNSEQVKALGRYGRIVGILNTLRDDFVDIFESYEIRNRIENETLPLPLVYTLQDKRSRCKLLPLLRKKTLTKIEVSKIAEIVLDSERVHDLVNEMQRMAKEALEALRSVIKPVNCVNFELVITALLEDLE